MPSATPTPILHAVADAGLDPARLAALIDEHLGSTTPRLAALWDYYRNPLRHAASPLAARRAGRPYRLGQERGLPLRLTNPAAIGVNIDDRAGSKREIVIENDIAWRIHAMIDFLFGRAVRIVTVAPDQQKAVRIQTILDAVWEGSGGLALLQEAALLVHGSADFLVRITGEDGELAAARDDAAAAKLIRIEAIDPQRAVPVVSVDDWRILEGYALHVTRPSGRFEDGRPVEETITEVFTPTLRQRFSTDQFGATVLLEQERNRVSPGVLPVVHVQNAAQPFAYEGLGEVEPLVPLQDELNTRLSDRANRVTMQSFKMWLAKGIDGFEKTPVGPGLLLSTDNPDAEVVAFGGDAASPSEESHIAEIREALDKLSGVPPLATGVVRAKIGNLSSETALRLTLQGLLARTARKRITYGRGIIEVSRLVLAALDHAGVLKTTEAERQVRLEWPDPIAGAGADTVRTAQAKADLGVSKDKVLTELGYAAAEAGVE
jgi:hypothetical protein